MIASPHFLNGDAPGLTDESTSDPLILMRESSAMNPQPRTVLNLLNTVFRTHCVDLEAVDVSGVWPVILEELKSDLCVLRTLSIRYQEGMTLREAARILGVPRHRVSTICGKARETLRHPCRIARIRNSIMGWPNLYRNFRGRVLTANHWTLNANLTGLERPDDGSRVVARALLFRNAPANPPVAEPRRRGESSTSGPVSRRRPAPLASRAA